MVRLKVSFSFISFSCFLLFQFHYGTIKRYLRFDGRKKIFKFQFHYGTIKRAEALQRWKEVAYFNSTMVRLKEMPAACLHG